MALSFLECHVIPYGNILVPLRRDVFLSSWCIRCATFDRSPQWVRMSGITSHPIAPYREAVGARTGPRAVRRAVAGTAVLPRRAASGGEASKRRDRAPDAERVVYSLDKYQSTC